MTMTESAKRTQAPTETDYVEPEFTDPEYLARVKARVEGGMSRGRAQILSARDVMRQRAEEWAASA